MMDGHWLPRLQALLAQGMAVVRIAVGAVRGSAPREAGATLLCWIDAGGRMQIHGSIGGGHLEMRATGIAAGLLQAQKERRRTERFTLGASLGQCCGGAVELFWERFDSPAQLRWADGLELARGGWRLTPVDGDEACMICAASPLQDGEAGFIINAGRRCFAERLHDARTPLIVYGAGHIGSALAQVLQGLPFDLRRIDSRDGMGDDVEQAEQPERIAKAAPAGAWHLVMTHSHDEDFRICEALVAGGRFGFLGVIGSATKQARFRSRLLRKGCRPEEVARMTSPIGIAGIASKQPASIAIAVAAQLLQMRESSVREQVNHGVRIA